LSITVNQPSALTGECVDDECGSAYFLKRIGLLFYVCEALE